MKELLQEQTTTDQADNSDSNNGVTTTPNWQREPIPNTPFWIVGNEEKGWNVILGKWKLTPQEIFIGLSLQYILDELIHNHLDTMKWQYILSTIICVTTDIEKQKQN